MKERDIYIYIYIERERENEREREKRYVKERMIKSKCILVKIDRMVCNRDG